MTVQHKTDHVVMLSYMCQVTSVASCSTKTSVWFCVRPCTLRVLKILLSQHGTPPLKTYTTQLLVRANYI